MPIVTVKLLGYGLNSKIPASLFLLSQNKRHKNKQSFRQIYKNSYEHYFNITTCVKRIFYTNFEIIHYLRTTCGWAASLDVAAAGGPRCN